MTGFALKKILSSAGSDLDHSLITQSYDETVYIVMGVSGPEYIAKSKPGTSLASPRWKISKMTYDANGNVTNIQWANGNTEYINTANDYASYTYS